MRDETDDPSLSARAELALARLALDGGDVRHAAEHVAAAIALAPALPEGHELLAQLAATAGGGIDLFPLDRPVFVGAVVARAHLLAARGRPAEALRLLAAASSHLPTAEWAGAAWVSDPDLPRQIQPGELAEIFMQLCTALPDPVAEAGRPPLQPYLTLARHAVQTRPGHGALLGAASALARRMGETDLAVAWAERGVAAEPSKLGELWLGYAHRSAGHTGAALTALQRAMAHDPDDLAVYADIAAILADAARLDEAIDWIDRALSRDPSFDCAVHTAHRLRYRRDGRVDHLVALTDFQRNHRDDSHEHTDLAECCAGRPWLGQVPPAGEVTVDVLRQLRAIAEPVSGAHLRLAALEPPSAMRTMAAAAPELTLSVTDRPEPDIRRPRRGEKSLLWRYEDMVAEPVVPGPSPAAAERLRGTAQPGWAHPTAAYDRAVDLAAVELDDLLGLLVHPPAPPADGPVRALADRDPAQWVRCVQVWTCLGLLHHRTDEPWMTSTRRRLLVELAWDVEDWVTEAAVFALVVAAWVDAGVRTDVAHLVSERLADAAAVTARRPVTIGWSLGQLALLTPGLGPSAGRQARSIIGAPAEPNRTPHPRRPAITHPARPTQPAARADDLMRIPAPADDLARVAAPADASAPLSGQADPPTPAGTRRPGRLRRWFTLRR